MVTVLGGAKLEFGLGVPKSEVVLETGGEDLSVVLGESNGVDLLSVVDKLLLALAGSEVPESEGLVPGRGKDEEVILGDRQVSDEMVMSGELLQGETELVFLGSLLVQRPDD